MNVFKNSMILNIDDFFSPTANPPIAIPHLANGTNAVALFSLKSVYTPP